jgi:hypothetical protein
MGRNDIQRPCNWGLTPQETLKPTSAHLIMFALQFWDMFTSTMDLLQDVEQLLQLLV